MHFDEYFEKDRLLNNSEKLMPRGISILFLNTIILEQSLNGKSEDALDNNTILEVMPRNKRAVQICSSHPPKAKFTTSNLEFLALSTLHINRSYSIPILFEETQR